MRTSRELTLEEYSEPVYYCRNCHSLAVVRDETLADGDWDGSYCDHCGSASIGMCTFGEWLEDEERREAARIRHEWNR